MRALRWGVTAAVATLALVALPSIVPMATYRARLEEAAAERLGETVSIARLRVALLPAPRVIAHDVAVGNHKEVRIGTAIIRPRLGSLLSAQKVLRRVEMRDVAVQQKALTRLLALAVPPDGGASPVRVERIVLENTTVHAPQDDIGPFAAEIDLTLRGQPERAVLRSADGKLRVNIQPDGDRFAVSVEAKHWTLPWGVPLEFDTLQMKGTATETGARFDDVAAQGYGGDATGEIRIGWKDGVEVSGALVLKKVQLAELLAALSKKSRVAGRLDAKPVFRTRAGDASAFHLQGPFQVHDAVLRGVDLQAAASLTQQDAKTGDTRFEQLSGALLMERGSYQLSRLKAASGALAARGDVAVSREKTLSGRVYAQLQPIGAATEVPLNVSGTIDQPSLAPTGGSIAGAAVGTAVLGPGIGTTIGAKVGEIAADFFGADKKKRRE